MATAETVVGQSVPTKLGRAKVTGRGRFAAETGSGNVLHAAALRSPVPHARISLLDTSQAEVLPGVRAVVTRADLGLDDRVRQYGDIVAAVAADTEQQARAALAAIDLELEELPAICDPWQSLEAKVVLHEAYPDNIAYRAEAGFGDVDGALGAPDVVVVEGRYRTGRPVHCNLSRHCCVARVNSEGQIELMSSVDGPYYARSDLAKLLGVEEGAIRITTPELLSSSFGGHSTVNFQHEPVAVKLSLKAGGQAVRYQYEPEDEFVAGHTRHAVDVRIRSGASRDGHLVALDVDVLADHGSYPNYISRVVLSNFRDRVGELLDVANYSYRGRAAMTNNVNAGEFRGIGSTQLMFALGCHLDEVATRLGLDPVEFYRRNIVKAGHVAITTGKRIESTGLDDCLTRGAKAIGWDRRKPADRPEGRIRGIGVGIGTHTTGVGHESGDHSSAAVKLNSDGSIDVMVAAPDSGQGASTIYAQVAAEELGVPYENVRVSPVDTAISPQDPWGTVASRGTYMVGGAVLDAARELRATLERASAGLMRVPEASVKFRNGGIDMVDVNGKGHRVDLKTVASKLPGLAGYGTFTSRVNPPTYGAYFAEVEVDTDTGQIRVVKVAAALDLGRAVNPAQCRGQIEGSVMMGVEMCLLGDLVHEDCLPLNASYFDYRLASTEDAPEIEAILVESAHEPSGPYGVKGIGTPAMTPIAPAICNAVSAALGVRVDTIPISPEWVLRVLGKLQP